MVVDDLLFIATHPSSSCLFLLHLSTVLIIYTLLYYSLFLYFIFSNSKITLSSLDSTYPSFVNIFRASIDELFANRFPQSDTSLVCGGTLHIINHTLDDDFIFLLSKVPFNRTLVAYGSPFFLSI
jgi:hypothetical protein